MQFAARQWQLGESDPFCAVLAANALTSPTEANEDHVWDLWLGRGDHAALALVTTFNRKAEFASIAPLWSVNNVVISQANGYSGSPVITRFLPGYLRAETRVTAALSVMAEYMAFESHATGGAYHLANNGTTPLSIRLELVAMAASKDGDYAMQVLPSAEGQAMLAFKIRKDFVPVLLMDGAKSDGMSPHKIGVSLKLNPGEKRTLRWCCAMKESATASIALAREWLAHDFGAWLKQAIDASASLPVIETGNADLDALLAAGVMQTMGAFVGQGETTSFLSPRAGMKPAGQSSGLATPTDAYLLAQAAAPLSPSLAQGVLSRFLSTQQADGFIDWRAGYADFRSALLCLPILARLTWGIFQYTEDEAFLRDAFPRMRAFFLRWFAADVDADGDGFPEWASWAQTGYPLALMHGGKLPIVDARDIRLTESPDLLAFLLSEAISIREMAFYLRDSVVEAEFDVHVTALSAKLEACWDESARSYRTRDRNTHAAHAPAALVTDLPGGETVTLGERLEAPARVMVSVVGGLNMSPQFELVITGLDKDGGSVLEHVSADAFVWSGGRGRYTSEAVFAAVDTLGTIGLTHLYKVSAGTPDHVRDDLSSILPVWAVAIPEAHRDALFERLLSEYLLPNGISMCSRTDPAYAPDEQFGAGGISVFWNTVMGEALIEAGQFDKSADLLMRVLRLQIQVLKTYDNTFAYYHPERARGLGAPGTVSGFVPLHWFMRVLGARVVNPRRVWAGGPYALPMPVTLHQHGVTITRSPKGTDITFPSGTKRHLPAEAVMMEVSDDADGAS